MAALLYVDASAVVKLIRTERGRQLIDRTLEIELDGASTPAPL